MGRTRRKMSLSTGIRKVYEKTHFSLRQLLYPFPACIQLSLDLLRPCLLVLWCIVEEAIHADGLPKFNIRMGLECAERLPVELGTLWDNESIVS